MKQNTSNNDEHELKNDIAYIDSFLKELANEKKMKPNTSNNDEHELSKRQFELWAKQLTEQFCKGVELGRTEGIKQGYAKALDDVGKIIDNIWKGRLHYSRIIRLKQRLQTLKEKKA